MLIGLFELPRDESVAGEDIPGSVSIVAEQQDDESLGSYEHFHLF